MRNCRPAHYFARWPASCPIVPTCYYELGSVTDRTLDTLPTGLDFGDVIVDRTDIGGSLGLFEVNWSSC